MSGITLETLVGVCKVCTSGDAVNQAYTDPTGGEVLPGSNPFLCLILIPVAGDQLKEAKRVKAENCSSCDLFPDCDATPVVHRNRPGIVIPRKILYIPKFIDSDSVE